jgi:predicted Rossmann fold nucleotide-binding protein DprA/Smf involved in DNA uptake
MGRDYTPWLALCRVKGLGCVSFKKLAAQFGDPTKAFSASKAELEAVEDLRAEAIDGLMHFDQWAEVEKELNSVRAAGVTLIPFSDANYPARLRTDRRSAADALC